MYSNIQQAVASVQNAFPSIYTKDDVIKLLESIQIQESSGKLSNEQIEELTRSIQERVVRVIDRADVSEVVDLGSAEFEISYNNQLELSSVDLDLSGLESEVECTIESTVTKFFEDLEESDVAELESEEENND